MQQQQQQQQQQMPQHPQQQAQQPHAMPQQQMQMQQQQQHPQFQQHQQMQQQMPQHPDMSQQMPQQQMPLLQQQMQQQQQQMGGTAHQQHLQQRPQHQQNGILPQPQMPMQQQQSQQQMQAPQQAPPQQYLQQNIRPGGPLQGRRFSNGGQNGYNANQQGPKPFAARDVQDVVAILRSRPNGTAELSSLAPQWHEAALREMATGRPDILRIQDRYITLHGVEVEKKPVADLFEAWHEFRPENSKHGELPLEVGELVTVTEQNASGWWKGIKVKSTGRGGPGPGWFPAAMVESLCGTMKPTGAGGRIAFFEMAASRILKFDPKASRMDVDLAG